MNIWIIIWRFNPLHIWHEALINESLKNNDKTIIILWSTDKIDSNNPLNKDKREELVKLIYVDFIDKWIIEIKNIADYESDLEWFLEIKKLLNSYLNEKLTFYWWDVKNDYAIKVIKQFRDKFENKIFFVEKSRKIINISATRIRLMLKEGDFKMLKRFVNEKIVKYLIEKSEFFR